MQINYQNPNNGQLGPWAGDIAQRDEYKGDKYKGNPNVKTKADFLRQREADQAQAKAAQEQDATLRNQPTNGPGGKVIDQLIRGQQGSTNLPNRSTMARACGVNPYSA